jgi:anti-sigma factor RsiW
MTCEQVREQFSAYLDGAISGREMQSMQAHLDGCSGCDEEFVSWRELQQVLGAVGAMKAPVDLGLRLRLAISHESARRQGHWWDVIAARWENMLRPALVQASAGFAGAVLLLGSLAMLVGVVAAPEAVLANDEPLGALTSPHYLYSTARLQPLITPQDETIVIQASVNSAGRVYAYTYVSGPTDEATDAQIRNELMLQVYEPARVFGEPVKSQVLVTFSGVSVHG